ncbi:MULTISPECIES: AAA family ATPase [Pseudomonas]|uniref:AAA family ATPase n=1 Tax=Pseudomonas auratipiscis TaxID=3115853 RepID=A0AB35WSZ7_9PSED|nr:MULTISPECIES: AAA family ATPase [unclassified Pseudomonas]MEE1866240.1 AAA family ATPase [Pseudomonas sp. 120P]MEE1957626.1 AAA family ATPase [Pseudomonas sp. 119P]
MQFTVPTNGDPIEIDVVQGTSVVFVGANGSGKTRLAIHIEAFGGESAHRISAHRALTLNPGVPKIRERQALAGLRFGHPDESAALYHRTGSRWQSKEASALLNDFDYVLQAMFAEQSRTSLETHKSVRDGKNLAANDTKFEKLQKIWQLLLPHRVLEISGDDIQVISPTTGATYSATDMSDGERAIFYLIGQVLVAAENSVLIVDEPELHVHRSIMNKLWDHLESARPDCAFVFITHDLEFAAGRVGQKFVIRDYNSVGPRWTIDTVPTDTGFTEEITTLLLGSRRPILFVEGDAKSLDKAVYRCAYPQWTVVPRGSCQEVVHAVTTLRANTELTRVQCAGIIDADGYDTTDIDAFEQMGVAVLPVSEIENLFLLPEISREIANAEHLAPEEIEVRLDGLKDDILTLAGQSDLTDRVVRMYCMRRIDRALKKTDLSKQDSIEGMKNAYILQTQSIDITAIAKERRTRIETAIAQGDIPTLLSLFDNKGMLAKASSRLKNTSRAPFEAWLARVLLNNKVPGLVKALRDVLPEIALPY